MVKIADNRMSLKQV